MGRWSLVVVLMVLLPVSARARRTPCSCGPGDQILPAPGARDVPRNTKVWSLGDHGGEARLEGGEAPLDAGSSLVTPDGPPIYRIDFGELAATRSYAFHGVVGSPSTQFTTGAYDDTTPPAPPVVHTLAIAVGDPGPATESGSMLTFTATLDPDVVLLRFTFTSDHVRYSVITTTDGWRWLGRPACHTELPFRGEHVSVAVSAIDLAGHESEPTTREIELQHGAATLPACARSHVRDGMGGTMLVGGAVILGVIVGLVVLLLAILGHFRRRQARE